MRKWILLALSLLPACTTAGSEAPAITTRNPTTVAPQERIDLTHENVISAVDFAARRVEVWNAMLSAYADLGFSVVATDETSGAAKFQFESRAGTLLGKPTGNFIDCGMGSAGPRVNTYRVTIKVTGSVASETADHTRLYTVLDATARSPGLNADPVQCTSRGTLEKHIVGMVAARLK